MKHRLLSPLVVAVALACGVPAQAPPRLLVLCSVDQLATWVLAAALPHMGDGGFRRLRRDGVDFEHCALVHGCTETGPGHATLGTGAAAAVHGIVKNEWWDREHGAAVYCVADAAVAGLPELPEGRQRSARWLMVPTFGDAMKAAIPGAKVVGIAWKDRAAILMSGRKADLAAWFEVATGRLVTNTAYVQAAPGWLLQFDAQKPLDTLFGWQWDRFASGAAYKGLQDDRPFEAVHQNGLKQRTLPQAITGGKDAAGPSFYADAYLSPLANTVTLAAAKAAIEGEALGADAVPDLLCVSFSSTDAIGHAFGPDSIEARDALLRLDAQLAQLLQYLDDRVGRGRYVFVLSADHGVGPVPEVAKAEGLDAGRGPLLLRARAAAEKALSAMTEPPLAGRYIQHAGGMALWFDATRLAEAAAATGKDGAAMRQQAAEVAAAAVARVPGIETAFATADLLQHGGGDDPIRRAMFAAVCAARVGDLLLVARPRWLDGGVCASHGSPHPYDREVPLLAMGPGLQAGARCSAAVSPGLGVVLMSRLLGLPKPEAASDEVPEGVLTR